MVTTQSLDKSMVYLSHYETKEKKAPSGQFQNVLKKLMDKDGDGNISSKEMKAFEKKYGNGDGLLTKDELKAGAMKGAAKYVRKDKEKKDGITEADVDKALSNLDKNEDEIISLKEIKAFLKGGDGKKSKSKEKYSNVSGSNIDDALDDIDKNNDEMISKKELNNKSYSGKDSRFAKMYNGLNPGDIDRVMKQIDKNSDSIITHKEIEQFVNSLKSKKMPTASEFIRDALDTNGDGKVSMQEMDGFEKKYGNGFGLLDKYELKAGFEAEVDKWVAREENNKETDRDAMQFIRDVLDKNGDGEITSKEMKEFEKKYGDGDGLLTKSELKAGIMAELAKQKTDRSDKKSDETDKLITPHAAAFIKDLLDKNDDGKVTSEEMKSFEKKYGNGDGLLTKDELKAGIKAELAKQKDKTIQNGIEHVLDIIDADENEVITVGELKKMIDGKA